MDVAKALRKYIIPILVSVGVHAFFAFVLFSHWETPTKTVSVKPKYIEAKLVELKQKTKPKQAQNKPKIVDLTIQRKQAERIKREAEIKQQALIKRKNAEKKKKDDAVKKAQEEERLKREQKEKEELQKLQERQKELDLKKAQEEQALLEESYATEAQSYAATIKKRIERYWSKPPSARKGMECILRINLVPTGRVITVDVIKSSGNEAFDRSAIQAVKKSEIFPEIKNMPSGLFESQFRQFTMGFSPEDSRL